MPKDYDGKIIRIYGAAGHRKRYVELVLNLLCRDVVGLAQSFSDSQEMCQYLRFRNAKGMVYTNIDLEVVYKRRLEKKVIKIKVCTARHLFALGRNPSKIPMDKYLCDRESCLNLKFSLCKKPVPSVSEAGDDFLEECIVGEDMMASLVCESEHAILCKSAFMQCQ